MIRRASKLDTPEIAELYKAPKREKLTTLQKIWSELLSDPQNIIFIEKVGTRVKGVLHAQMDNLQNQLRIVELFVAANKRYRGLEISLIRSALKSNFASAVPTVVVVSNKDRTSIELYTQAGFVIMPASNELSPNTQKMMRTCELQ